MKTAIFLGFTVVSTLFGWIGDIIGHGWFSAWSLILSTIGCFVGIWVGYKAYKYFF